MKRVSFERSLKVGAQEPGDRLASLVGTRGTLLESVSTPYGQLDRCRSDVGEDQWRPGTRAINDFLAAVTGMGAQDHRPPAQHWCIDQPYIITRTYSFLTQDSSRLYARIGVAT